MHSNLFEYILAGVSYRTALKRAKIDMIAQGNLPVYWAGYVLVGA